MKSSSSYFTTQSGDHLTGTQPARRNIQILFSTLRPSCEVLGKSPQARLLKAFDAKRCRQMSTRTLKSMWAPKSHDCNKYPLIFRTSVAQGLRGGKVSSLMWFPVQLQECLSQRKEGSSMEARSWGREKAGGSFLMTVVIYATFNWSWNSRLKPYSCTLQQRNLSHCGALALLLVKEGKN